jgi:FkbM family methyltransferase
MSSVKRLNPIGRALLLLNQNKRRDHRQFSKFPPIDYQRVLDVGAHRGEFTDGVLRYFRPQRVWLVEADPRLAEALRAKYVRQPQCRIVHAAISEASGTTDFRINVHSDSSSLLPISPISGKLFRRDMQEVQIVQVPACSLDDLFQREAIDRVDLMKVDIQGAERLLIRGGVAALQRVRCIYIEVLFEEFYHGCALFGEIQALLIAAGFKLQLLQDFRRSAEGYLLYANALYRRPEV